MFSLAVIRQNGCILSMILCQFGICEPFRMTSVRSGLFRDAPGSGTTSSGWVVVLVKDRGSSRVLGLAASRTGASPSN
jgi:hypothetical protein